MDQQYNSTVLFFADGRGARPAFQVDPEIQSRGAVRGHSSIIPTTVSKLLEAVVGTTMEFDRSSDPLEKFEKRCPPGGEQRVVLYFTSLRGIRQTYENCSHLKHILHNLRSNVDERDVSMHADFRRELKDLLNSSKPVPVPRLFIKGRYIGGAEEVSVLHEDGILNRLLQSLPSQTSWEQCKGCGGMRFVPCFHCSGSCKLIEENMSIRCPDCNENGLIRCTLCF